jgi:Protein of unknown function (DUF3551)
MKKIFAFSALATLAGSAFLITAEPAAARDYEYCRQDSSGMNSCSFDTMEQCVAMMSGRGGSCSRNPFLAEASASYAYAPKHHAHTRRQRAD